MCWEFFSCIVQYEVFVVIPRCVGVFNFYLLFLPLVLFSVLAFHVFGDGWQGTWYFSFARSSLIVIRLENLYELPLHTKLGNIDGHLSTVFIPAFYFGFRSFWKFANLDVPFW